VKPVSTVGIRASWKCQTCSAVVTSFQIVELSERKRVGCGVVVDEPHGWVLDGRASYCSPKCLPIEAEAA